MKKSLLALAVAFSVALPSMAGAVVRSPWTDIAYGDVQMKYKNPDYRLAAKYYGRSASEGNKWGQQKLGELYESGKGVKKDYAKAASLYRQSMKQGNPWAKFKYASLLAEGKGVRKDVRTAVKLLVEAEKETGSQWVQLRLGQVLLPYQPESGKRFLIKAAKAGNAYAAKELAAL